MGQDATFPPQAAAPLPLASSPTPVRAGSEGSVTADAVVAEHIEGQGAMCQSVVTHTPAGS